MNSKPILKAKIEKYLRIPLFLSILILLMAGIMFWINLSAGIAMIAFGVVYFLIALAIYYNQKPNIMNELVGFAFEHGQIQKELLKDLAVPYALVDFDGRILWGNNEFFVAIGKDKANKRYIHQIFQEITKELLPTENKKNVLELTYEEHSYRVEMKRVCVKELLTEDSEEVGNSIIAVYIFDETEVKKYIKENQEQKLVTGLIYIDNYEEALESIEEVRRSLLIALIDRKVNKYMQNLDAIVKKLEKDKFLVVFQQKYLKQLQTTKFSILDEIKAINIGNEMAVTLSISLGVGADTYLQSYDYARVGMDLALGRGGDQAVVKEGEKIYYYGGKTQVVEKTTRVKARVKAHALREIFETKDKVIIMGHKLPDVDSLGAAIGIYRLAKTLNKKAHIVINEATISIRPVINNFIGNSLYDEDLFINSEDAIDLVDNSTALVVVDVNRPSYTECSDLLGMVKSIVVLDHHRQTSETINNAILSYVEPYASSACEMVAEILQYIVDKPKLKPIEADAMYAGILVDTDNFVTKAGVRTFEAAAFLRRSGADVTRVRKLFRSDMSLYRYRAKAVSSAQLYMESYAFAVMPTDKVDSPTVIGAQVANELLDIDGIRASFVFTSVKNIIYISARSIDDVNVQVIMEKLGGGGHASVAGAQLTDVSIDNAMKELQDILKQMTDEGEI